MRLGFIGTGGITESIIHGIHHSSNFEFDLDIINVSQRNAQRSNRLSCRYDLVSVVKTNQELIDNSDWIFLAVLPDQAQSVVDELVFSQEKQLVSLVAGVSVSQLQNWTGIQNVVRIIPLPPVEIGSGPIPIFPANSDVEQFLNQIGTAINIDDEDKFSAFSAASAIMATYFEFTSTVAKWIKRQGISDNAAAVYSTTMLRALAETTINKEFDQLIGMSEECLTPGGLNEQILFDKRKNNWFESLVLNLDQVMNRIK